MREFTKSVASAGLAMSIFSARQMATVVTRSPGKGEANPATDAFNAIAQAAADQCGDSLRETFHGLDKMQRSSIDSAFRFAKLESLTSGGGTQSFSGMFNQATEQMRGWLKEGCACRGAGDSEFESDCDCDSQNYS